MSVCSCLLLLLPDINQTVRIVLYSLIFLLSVLGNSLIIAVLVRNRRMRTVTNLFLLSLAVSDLMVSLVCVPFTLIPNLMRDFVFGTGMCKLVMYFMGERGFRVLQCTQDSLRKVWKSVVLSIQVR